jgi:hypothetical protein
LPRRAILTSQVMAGIPALVEQGLRKADIAEMLGCKESTLQVRCSIAGISLRGLKRIRLQTSGEVALSPTTLAGLRARASAMGCSETRLVGDLLEMIARDNLYDAVLDAAPLQPAE